MRAQGLHYMFGLGTRLLVVASAHNGVTVRQNTGNFYITSCLIKRIDVVVLGRNQTFLCCVNGTLHEKSTCYRANASEWLFDLQIYRPNFPVVSKLSTQNIKTRPVDNTYQAVNQYLSGICESKHFTLLGGGWQ